MSSIQEVGTEGIPLYTKVFSFQGVRIEKFHYRGVFNSGG